MIKKGERKMFWHRHVSAFRASGQTRVAYCREHGLKAHQLDYRLNRAGKRVSASKSAFARVITAEVPAPAVPKAAAVRLCFRDGMVLELEAGIDPAWIARLIAHIRGRP